MADETLMTEASQATTEGSSASQDDAQAAASAADEATSTPAAGGDTQSGSDTEAGAESQAGDSQSGEDKLAGAPEAYADFDMPEGTQLHPELTADMKTLGKELNLPQEAAQKVVNLGMKMAAQWATDFEENMQSARAAWKEQATNDPEYGGAKLQESLAAAHKARDAFVSPELRTLLAESGLGNHPEVVRLFVKVGQAISEDRLVTGGDAPPAKNPDRAKRLYPNMN